MGHQFPLVSHGNCKEEIVEKEGRCKGKLGRDNEESSGEQEAGRRLSRTGQAARLRSEESAQGRFLIPDATRLGKFPSRVARLGTAERLTARLRSQIE
jgi:hypothetical protein